MTHLSKSDQVLTGQTDVSLVRAVGDYRLDKARGLLGHVISGTMTGFKDDVVGTEVTVWGQVGTGSYVFPTTAETIRVKASGDADDDAGQVGARTVEVSVLDDMWLPQTITLTTAGVSAGPASSVLVRRVNGVDIGDTGTYGGRNVGTVVIENTTTFEELAVVPPGRGVAHQAIYTVPAGYTMFVKLLSVNVGDANKSTIKVYVRPGADIVSAPFRSPRVFSQYSEVYGTGTHIPETLRPVPEKSDVYVTAERISGGGNSLCAVVMDFDLVENAP